MSIPLYWKWMLSTSKRPELATSRKNSSWPRSDCAPAPAAARHAAAGSSRPVAATDARWNATVAGLAYSRLLSASILGSARRAAGARARSNHANSGG